MSSLLTGNAQPGAPSKPNASYLEMAEAAFAADSAMARAAPAQPAVSHGAPVAVVGLPPTNHPQITSEGILVGTQNVPPKAKPPPPTSNNVTLIGLPPTPDQLLNHPQVASDGSLAGAGANATLSGGAHAPSTMQPDGVFLGLPPTPDELAGHPNIDASSGKYRYVVRR